MTSLLRARPSLVFVPFVANVALYGWLLSHGARFTGVFISAVMAAGGLVFLFLCLRSGFVLGRRERYSIDQQPRQFWSSMALVVGWYFLVSFFAVCLYLKDIGYLSHE